MFKYNDLNENIFYHMIKDFTLGLCDKLEDDLRNPLTWDLYIDGDDLFN